MGDFLNTVKRYIVFFLVGSLGYGAIELLWRGHTHWTMLIAGGICFSCFSVVANKLNKRSLILKSIICALIVTTVEFIFGMIFNVGLNMNVWNYSEVPFNLYGQICPLFTFLWVGLSLILLPLVDRLNARLC